MKKILFPVLMCTLMLAACKPTGSTQDTQPAADTGEKRVIEFPDTDMKDDSAMEDDMMGHDMMDDMMAMGETEALKEGCIELRRKSVEERTKILEDISHNMDTGALEYLLGPKCTMLGEVVKVADITEEELKIMPGDDLEALYFNALTNRFFGTCSMAQTVAYVVEKDDPSVTPEEYFAQNREKFVETVQMMKDMMHDMDMDMDHMDDDEDDDEGMDEDDEDEDNDEDEGENQDEDEMMDEDSAGTYGPYEDGVIGNGETSVLFFAAEWCPKCQANHAKLAKWYDEDSFPRSVYRLDYDEETELKQRYGIVQQDAFVLIDGEGNALDSVNFPTESKLKELIGA